MTTSVVVVSNSSVDTINAAATAIVTAESRVQPTIEKRRWITHFSKYWCFGSHKNNKRIGHAVLVPEPLIVPGTASAPPTAQTLNNSTTIIQPFIAPPSSPASFLQSVPSSGTQSPAKFLSSNTYSPHGPANVFAVGPYAHEKQLVSPPVFSAFPTEPSTAPYTPPPDSAPYTPPPESSVQMTRPSSPEVPFAQLLTSSLNRTRRSSGSKFPLSQYEYQPYYPGSPGSRLISPGSVMSTSGTSTPLPDRRTIFETRVGEPPKVLGFEYFTHHKWGSRLGSGSLTPDGVGPGSGTLTPDGGTLAIPNSFFPGNQISENGCQHNEALIDHRVSFELTVKDVARCFEKEPLGLIKNESETHNENYEKPMDGEEEHGYRKHRSITLGSIKEFNFDSTNGEEISEKTAISSDWWANEKVVGEDDGACNNWSFFPVLQPGAQAQGNGLANT